MTTRQWAKRAMAVVAISMAANACGSSGESSTATTAAGSAGTPASGAPASSVAAAPVAPAGAGAGACKYLTTAQAAGLAASPVKPGVARTLATPPVTFEYCDYIFDPGNAPGVTVAVADLGTNGVSFFGQFRQSKATADEFQEVPGVGDEAFYGSGNLNVRKGNKGLILFVGRSDSLPRGAKAIPDEKQLAALILPQL
jgi:hypothetical protein